MAAHVAEAVGVDPEPEMLAEAARRARDGGVLNVIWAQGDSNDLPVDLGYFRLVTMGRCFHWMDRERVLEALDDLVVDGGALVIVNDGCLVHANAPWQRAIEQVQANFLPPNPAPAALAGPTHQRVLADSAFRHVDRRVYEFSRTGTIDHVIGYLYSTSLPLRRLLGDRRPAVEEAITEAILALAPSGVLTEPVGLEVLIARRPLR